MIDPNISAVTLSKFVKSLEGDSRDDLLQITTDLMKFAYLYDDCNADWVVNIVNEWSQSYGDEANAMYLTATKAQLIDLARMLVLTPPPYDPESHPPYEVSASKIYKWHSKVACLLHTSHWLDKPKAQTYPFPKGKSETIEAVHNMFKNQDIAGLTGIFNHVLSGMNSGKKVYTVHCQYVRALYEKMHILADNEEDAYNIVQQAVDNDEWKSHASENLIINVTKGGDSNE